ncbi:MAG: hypothetical protein U0Z75_09545 [Deinococcaceae bacterium]
MNKVKQRRGDFLLLFFVKNVNYSQQHWEKLQQVLVPFPLFLAAKTEPENAMPTKTKAIIFFILIHRP